jgi:hypothetical protein
VALSTRGVVAVYFVVMVVMVVALLVGGWWLLIRALNAEQVPEQGGSLGDLALGKRNTRRGRTSRRQNEIEPKAPRKRAV